MSDTLNLEFEDFEKRPLKDFDRSGETGIDIHGNQDPVVGVDNVDSEQT